MNKITLVVAVAVVVVSLFFCGTGFASIIEEDDIEARHEAWMSKIMQPAAPNFGQAALSPAQKDDNLDFVDYSGKTPMPDDPDGSKTFFYGPHTFIYTPVTQPPSDPKFLRAAWLSLEAIKQSSPNANGGVVINQPPSDPKFLRAAWLSLEAIKQSEPRPDDGFSDFLDIPQQPSTNVGAELFERLAVQEQIQNNNASLPEGVSIAAPQTVDKKNEVLTALN